jgi:perosamine synthetase
MRETRLSRREFALGVTAAGLTSVSARSQSPTGKGAAAAGGRPAILGGTRLRTDPFPSWPTMESIDEAKFLNSLREKKWCRLYGDETTTFEQEWARLLGARHAIGVVNGTNALYAGLAALDVGPGDEVLVPAYTFVATVNAVIQQFALPVFIDTDLETHLVDTSKLEAAVNENTRCIMPVHLGGNVANLDEIQRIAAARGLAVIEDACQAHFAEWRGKRVGSLSDVGCFSFQSTKILPCGEGGAVVTSRDDVHDRLHAFQNNGRDRVKGTRDGYQHQGSNLRMTEFQAALLQAQLTRLEGQCRTREENARHLTSMLEQIPGIRPARLYPGCTRNTYYVYMASYDPEGFAGLSRSGFLRALRHEGISCGTGYGPLNREPFLEKTFASRGFRRIYPEQRLKRYREMNQCPANDRLCEEGLFFSHTLLLGGRGDVEQVAEAIARIQRHAGEIAKLQA